MNRVMTMMVGLIVIIDFHLLSKSAHSHPAGNDSDASNLMIRLEKLLSTLKGLAGDDGDLSLSVVSSRATS